MEKYGFVYIWFDRKYKRFYVGSHWGYEDDGYICSSRWMRISYRRRPDDFKRRIIVRVFDRKVLLVEEHKWLSFIKEKELGKRYYNLRNCEFNHWSTGDKLLTLPEKISANTKEAMWKPEIREKYLNGLKNRDLSVMQTPEVKAKRSLALKGKNKGRKHEGQALENLRQAAKTRKQNKEALSRGGTSACNIMNSRKVTCIKCGFEGNPGTIGRYHNDNCKDNLLFRKVG